MNELIEQAERALIAWRKTPFERRKEIALAFASLLDDNFALLISDEIGKPFWESQTEVASMKKKVELAIQAHLERCPTSDTLQHKPHGIGAVFGPFNFPGHLPNGHIVPLLLAGNCLIFKPSELAPRVGARMCELWQQAGLPEGVLTLIQGGPDVGKALVQNPKIKGIYFTGSFGAGQSILQGSLQFPQRIVALEMGGNNPLIISRSNNLEAQVFHTIQSAYITSGQRCTAARRLIVIQNEMTDSYLDLLMKRAKNLIIAPHTMRPEPYMGPVVSSAAAKKIVHQYERLIDMGAKVLMPMKLLEEDGAYLSPGLLDCSSITAPDEEIFGPLLQLTFVKDLASAIQKANQTEYGLSAAILSDNPQEFEQVFDEVNAGVINWNAPTTGASSSAPFGGIGKSGNFRPSGYWSADYSSYPVAITKKAALSLPDTLPKGYPIV